MNVSNGAAPAGATAAPAAAAPTAAARAPATGRSKVAQDLASRVKSLPLGQKLILGAALFFVA
ncbi:MAG: hypothetical protein ACO2Z7_06685, partial [Burkholderiaceae bacterium]